jgi:DnaJ-class molecular chaperone
MKKDDLKVDCGACHEGAEEIYKTSVHHLQAEISCKECHGYHYVAPLTNPQSATYRTNLVQTCGACHSEEGKQFAESVHGVGLSRGRPNHPTCTTCHGTHGIKPRTDPASAVHERRIAITTCPQCHAAEQITREYRLTTKPVRSYYDSFHGLSYRGGDTFSANCASCHGVHDIRSPSDPKSMVHKDNLQETCGTCHPGASVNFARGKIHTLPDIRGTDLGARAVGWVRIVYIILIVTVIGGLSFFNFTDWLRKTIDRRPKS